MILNNLKATRGNLLNIELWVRSYALEIAMVIILLALFAMLGGLTWIYMQSPATAALQSEQQRYLQQIQQEQDTPAAKRAWNRLYRKHGQPGAVIYEPGKTPYYTGKDGQKCAFI
jgi:hypothetical protein